MRGKKKNSKNEGERKKEEVRKTKDEGERKK